MTSRALGSVRIAAVVAAMLAVAGSARAAPHFDPTTAESVIEEARKGGADAFCTKPATPLSPTARAMCGDARAIARCEGFAKACDADPFALSKTPPKVDPPKTDFGSIGSFLSTLASVLMWLLIGGAVLAIVVFVVRALLGAKRDRALSDEPAAPAVAVAHAPEGPALETTSDAELLLRRADDHARRGELDRATALYLAASLRALDRRGAIRLARHRTNGEYVRGCTDPGAKAALREIVRQVDRVQYGHQAATSEATTEVASRAGAIVRAAAGAAVLMIALLGCGPPRGPIPRAADPGGDDLFFALLEKQGATVKRLGGSLASLAMPKPGERSPVVVLDTDRVPLEDETRAHLIRWVEAGGALVLAGSVERWPDELGAKRRVTTSADVKVVLPIDGEDEDEDAEEETSEDDEKAASPAFVFHDVHLAEPAGVTWTQAMEMASTGDHATWAGTRRLGRGTLLGMASDDLLTNAGLARSPNAAALVALVAPFEGRTFEVARPQDGIMPSSNPLQSLVRAGLGLGLVHAAIATALLLLAYGIRQARARPTPPPSRRAWTEHLVATGGLYARTRLAPHALSAYARFVDGRLRARMPRGMTDPSAFLALRSKADPGHCAAVWSRALAARSDERARGDELGTLRELHALYAAAVKTG